MVSTIPMMVPKVLAKMFFTNGWLNHCMRGIRMRSKAESEGTNKKHPVGCLSFCDNLLLFTQILDGERAGNCPMTCTFPYSRRFSIDTCVDLHESGSLNLIVLNDYILTGAFSGVLECFSHFLEIPHFKHVKANGRLSFSIASINRYAFAYLKWPS